MFLRFRDRRGGATRGRRLRLRVVRLVPHDLLHFFVVFDLLPQFHELHLKRELFLIRLRFQARHFVYRAVAVLEGFVAHLNHGAHFRFFFVKLDNQLFVNVVEHQPLFSQVVYCVS